MGLLAGVGMFSLSMFAIRLFPAYWSSLKQLRDAPRSQLFRASVISGLLGGITHIFLDSCMHRDMNPFWPFIQGNSLAGIIDVGALHIALAACGFFGLFLWMVSLSQQQL